MKLALLLLLPALAIGAVPDAPLEGVWGAKRTFGPDTRGPLEIIRSKGEWRARIARFEVGARESNGRVSFTLPEGEGSFTGRLQPNGRSMRGYWTQRATVIDGMGYITPLTLQADATGNRWQGDVVPHEDELTLYLVFSQAADGGTRVFIRNPERNMGIFWQVDRIERAGEQVKLFGKWRGRGNERLFAEGTYRAEEKVLSLYFPSRGGSYDFTPIDAQSDFYARGRDAAPYRYRPPVPYDDGWKTGTLTEVGLAAAAIEEFVRAATQDPKSVEDLDLHALLIARHGKLVVEEYFHGFHRWKPHETRSAGKVVATMLVGAAMESGEMDTSTKVYEALGADPSSDERKTRMTVGHLLTMSSGYDCDDWDGSRPGSEDHILDDMPDRDFYRYTLALPMELEPGKQAIYCSINPNLAGAVVAAKTRRAIAELFDERIARPLRMTRWHINTQPTGEPYLGGGIKILPRDFMKLGQVLLDGGTWNGERILPKEFAVRAGSPLMTLRNQPAGMRYGYLWWTIDYPYRDKTITAYFASGNGGQVVVVIPDLDMVIACYGGNYNGRAGWAVVRELIPKHLLGAAEGSPRVLSERPLTSLRGY
ncbi:MAG TPA: serine hydrolase domain-containing protein [Usitatibacter sp.]|nr:serine hydrolase domain-containing protein [Usitatibacter sp.]